MWISPPPISTLSPEAGLSVPGTKSPSSQEHQAPAPESATQVFLALSLRETRAVLARSDRTLGATKVDLGHLMKTSDVISIHVNKTKETENLIDSKALNMIKEGSKLNMNSLTDTENMTMMSLSGVKRFPMRVKCATLAWHTFIEAIEGNKKIVNTEN